MNYKIWLRSLKTNPWHPKSKRVMRRHVGRWIRRWEKKHHDSVTVQNDFEIEKESDG